MIRADLCDSPMTNGGHCACPERLDATLDEPSDPGYARRLRPYPLILIGARRLAAPHDAQRQHAQQTYKAHRTEEARRLCLADSVSRLIGLASIATRSS